MRLRAVDLHGYKSFAARTTLQFDTPVTAIVGPNGSGKSNVMDALRWAIGAGSGRSLRTKRAEDVVFSGGRDRAPSGFAEVRVQLDNSDEWLGIDAAEVEIVRRVHRDGQSEVRLNGRSARLRDVQDLFRSSGLGAGGFALMSQGLVDEMLRLRPQERRQAIEEVGGVRQHRHQMEESRRRRQRAQEHLERARLLRDELAPRLKSLERAARRARRFADLQGQLSQAHQDYFQAAGVEIEQELLRRHETAALAAAARTAAERRREEATADLAAVERETSIARRSVEAAAEKIRAARSELRSLEHQQELDQQQRSWLSREAENLASRLSTERRDSHAIDLDGAKQALSEVNTRLTALRSERDSRERAQARASAQHERALTNIESVRGQATILARRWKATAATLSLSRASERSTAQSFQDAQSQLERAEDMLRRAERQLAEVGEQVDQIESERAALVRRIDDVTRQIQIIEEADQRSESLRTLVQARLDDPVRAEALFGELIDAALYDEFDEAITEVTRIAQADAGRATAILRRHAQDLITSSLADTAFVDDIASAVASARNGRVAVTADGIVIRPGGVVQAGASRPGARRLRQQMDELKSLRSQLVKQLSQIKHALTDQPAIEELETAREHAASLVETAQRSASACRFKHEAVLQLRATAAAQQRSDALEIRKLRKQLDQARRDERESAQQLKAARATERSDVAELELQRDRLAAELAEARAQAATQERARADRARLYSLRRELETVESTIRDREPLLESAASAASETTSHQLANEHLAVLDRRRADAAALLDQAQQSRVTAERKDVEAAAELRETESIRARLAAEAAAEGVAINSATQTSQPTLDLNGGNGAGRQIGNGTTSEGRPGLNTAVAVADLPVAMLKQIVDDLRGKMQRIGPVDPGAAQEFDVEQQRWQNTEVQIADLESTELALRQAERDLEQLIERKFRDACRQVDQAFQHYFQLMFRGGRAELVLTDDSASDAEDPEARSERSSLGVEIRAQPPGKRVSALGLLSGGERALTAIALLFALLEVRPAPFCVLDEVDAALDEANVERFVSALKERARHTQFVVITHNRRTIEQADGIYGVTMGAAGVSRLLSVRLDQLPQSNS
jgi:chromosome segregation protein